MAEEMKRGYCRTCEQYGPVTRKGINHILHLILSLVTLGAWFFIWVALALFNVGGWRCPRCGGDNIDQLGELFSIKGWSLFIVLVLVVRLVNPELMESSLWIIIVGSIPVFLIGAHMQKTRQEDGAKQQVRVSVESVYTPAADEKPSPAEPRPQRRHKPAQDVVATFDPPVMVRFDYQGDDDDAPQPRSVEVAQLLRRDDKLYLHGWCELRDDVRLFRTDRIVGSATVEATGESIGMQILTTPARLQMALMAANVL